MLPNASSGNLLQNSVDRFARALVVPSRLLKVHPRERGHSGDFAALAPAITLGVIAAFEGFVEDFTASCLFARGQSLAHIAKAVGNLNNPDVLKFSDLLSKQLGLDIQAATEGYEVQLWKPPIAGKSWWRLESKSWQESSSDAEGWMQVRHLLTHGLASGWGSEHWPEPLRKDASRSATSVLKPVTSGKSSLVIHGAISCARIYVEAAKHLAGAAGGMLNQELSFKRIPAFPLGKAVEV